MTQQFIIGNLYNAFKNKEPIETNFNPKFFLSADVRATCIIRKVRNRKIWRINFLNERHEHKK